MQKYFENVNKGEPYPNNAAPAAAGEGWHSSLACRPVQLRLAGFLLHAALLSCWRPSSSISCITRAFVPLQQASLALRICVVGPACNIHSLIGSVCWQRCRIEA